MSDRHLTPVPPPDDEPDYSAPPQDIAAERAVLGSMLLSRTAIEDVTTIVTGSDYYKPAHELIHAAIQSLYARLEPVDTITVTDRLTKDGNLGRIGGPAYLHQLTLDVATPAGAAYHAAIVRDYADRRRLATLATQLRAQAHAPLDTPLADMLDAARQQIEQIPIGVPGVEAQAAPGLAVDDFLGGDEGDEYDWLVPDFLERTDRVIVTAAEGVGKSTLLRQWAVQIAAGIHPVTGQRVTPARVLVLDLENSKRQTRRKLRPLHAKVAHSINPSNLIVHCKGEGLDLTSHEDVAWLDRMLAYHQPDLLITGPIYKLAGGNPNDEQDAKPAALNLDAMRARHGVTVILEAHSKKGEGGKHRPKEPFGWSGWMRWPEFGFHLGDDGTVTHWRGMRDERVFPHQLNKGGEWPWSPVVNLEAQRINAIKALIEEMGRKPTYRDIEKATGIPYKSAQRLWEQHAQELSGAVYSVQSNPKAAASDDQ